MLKTQYEIDKYTVQKKDYNIYKCRGGRVLKNKNTKWVLINVLKLLSSPILNGNNMLFIRLFLLSQFYTFVSILLFYKIFLLHFEKCLWFLK